MNPDLDIKELRKKLNRCYSKDLCYPKVKDKWDKNNKSFGMCAITALVVNDYYGGEICKIYVDGISHYFNIVNDKIIDLTSNQFGKSINYDNYQKVDRKEMLTNDTQKRYKYLKQKLSSI